MDKYEVIHLLGEGSFGRVYKAKQTADSTFVALKVISKRGRSNKELKGLRRECEIQRCLHHPNIIQMLDSFETENEIVVITEFAHKALNVILSADGYFPENRVQEIVWDLVSALYYLHSHRVLHRDLKPQNILLDSRNCAKLCDFGFARNMSTGTHVLTSIKGTPLYMAPELIEEQPYDHNADLWSLGCIIYELLVGAAPFNTTSILHLIRLIRYESIQWPTFISENCISFLKGLLQKKPSKRMTWPEILNHQFVKGHVIISEDSPLMALTRPLSANTLQVKEQQKINFTQKTQLKPKSTETSNEVNVESTEVNTPKESKASTSDAVVNSDNHNSGEQDLSENKETICEKIKNLSVDVNNLVNSKEESKIMCNVKTSDNNVSESEEWIVLLLHSIEEIMNGDLKSLGQPNLTNLFVSPLRNSNATPKVLCYVSKLFSLPFTVTAVNKRTSDLEQIKIVYFEVKLVHNLIYASKLLMSVKSLKSDSKNSSPSPTLEVCKPIRPINDLTDEELQALEYIYMLICHLVHLDNQFLNQFCVSVVKLNVFNMLNRFLFLSRRKLRIVIDLIAILTQVLRSCPENNELVEHIILDNNVNESDESVKFVDLLRHSSSLLRERMCYLLLFLTKHSFKTLEAIWSDKVKDTLEALVYDSMENVRNAAEKTVEEMKIMDFFNNTVILDTLQCNKSK